MKTAVIDGITYNLVPVEKEDAAADYVPSPKEEPKQEVGVSGFPRAVPTVSDYRERLKQKKLTSRDVTAPPRPVDLPDRSAPLSGFTYKGESLFYGPGLEEDF